MLETNLQENENLHKKCENLESELRERDCKLQNVMIELERKSQNISQLNLKIRTLDDEIKSIKGEIEIKENVSMSNEKVMKKKMIEMDDLRKELSEFRTLSNKDRKQIDSLKSSITVRDNTISELENKLERCKDVIRNLEAKLEKIAHEKKRKEEELNSMILERKSKNANEKMKLSNCLTCKNAQTNISSNFDQTNREEYVDDINSLKDALKKKEDQHRNACSMIHSCIISKKMLEKKNLDLQQALEQQEKKLIDMQKEFKKSNLSNNSFNSSKSGTHNTSQFDFEVCRRKFFLDKCTHLP